MVWFSFDILWGLYLPAHSFCSMSSHVDDLNTHNMVSTANLLRQGYRYQNIRKAFLKIYPRYYDLASKYNVGLKTFLLHGLSKPEFYGDVLYKFRKIVGKNNFLYQFKIVQKDKCSRTEHE